MICTIDSIMMHHINASVECLELLLVTEFVFIFLDIYCENSANIFQNLDQVSSKFFPLSIVLRGEKVCGKCKQMMKSCFCQTWASGISSSALARNMKANLFLGKLHSSEFIRLMTAACFVQTTSEVQVESLRKVVVRDSKHCDVQPVWTVKSHVEAWAHFPCRCQLFLSDFWLVGYTCKGPEGIARMLQIHVSPKPDCYYESGKVFKLTMVKIF